LSLPGTDGINHVVGAPSSPSRLTVLFFFSAHCPCQRIHDPRVVALANTYAARGVQFLAVDSEYGSSLQNDLIEARQRAYPFPILRDDDGKLAKALDVHFATESVVIDAQGLVKYRGGIDSDKRHLHEDAKEYLRDAMEALLSGREPNPAQPKSMGCYLTGT
jgi:hypothetical protein